MLPSAWRWMLQWRYASKRSKKNRRWLVKILGVILLLVLVSIEIAPFATVRANPSNHTVQTVNNACEGLSFSPDGNPYSLCPGPYPLGGNCVWWAWEQWHLLGYDLPRNWGNAADWAVDAAASGFTLGTKPRVGAIAVFPRGDGVWAWTSAGHVAFVTAVSDDGQTFDVTYQNYGDPKFMYIGTDYNVSVINQPAFQNGLLRFIYYPRPIDPQRFAQLPGINQSDPVAAVEQANQQSAEQSQTSYGNAGITRPTFTNDRVAFGVTPDSGQEFNADFSGKGLSELLLYNRAQGDLSILRLDQGDNTGSSGQQASTPVHLGDDIVGQGKWGSTLDIHIGEFSGSGETEVLLYDRAAGTIQLLSFNPDLTIKKHVTLSDIGLGWEIYTGRFDGQRTALFMYRRFAFTDPYSAINNSNPPDTNSDTNTSDTNSNNSDDNGSTDTSGSNNAGANNTTTATPTPTSTETATPSPTPTPTATPTPTPTAVPIPTPTPSPVPTPAPTPAPTAAPTPTATPTPAPASTAPPASSTQTPTSTSTSTETPAPTASPEATSASSSPTAAKVSFVTTPDDNGGDNATSGNNDLSGEQLQEWERKGRTANILLLDFDQDFQIHNQQEYTLWHANWEVYVGPFLGANHDALFLYDRAVGEGRLMSFDGNLLLGDYQEMHGLQGNWLVYSGDFADAGRAQMLLYDPSSGEVQILSFDEHLVQRNRKSYDNLGTNRLLYVGHFGMPTLSIMLYDPQEAQSSFIGFDKSLAITSQYLTKSWDQSRQILVGSFVDRSRCVKDGDCTRGDDILVLNRKNGQIEQYVFSFGRTFEVYDNRTQAFIRLGADSRDYINSIDTTTFRQVRTLSTTIKDEELY